MNTKPPEEEKLRDLKVDDPTLHQKSITARRDAGEPGKANLFKTRGVQNSNNAKTTERGSKESDRGDSADKVSQDHKKGPGKYTTSAGRNESFLKGADASNVSKINAKLPNTENHLVEAKYNKIMPGINKIIQENIDLINTKTVAIDDAKNEVAKENIKVTGESYIDKKDTFKQPDKLQKRELAKKEDKALINFSKKMTNTKASNCTPLDVAKTVNDVKNKALVIKIPKNISGYKLQEKQKVNEMNKTNPRISSETQSKVNSFQQRNIVQVEKCTNPQDTMARNSYWATKIPTVPKNVTKHLTPIRANCKTETHGNGDSYAKVKGTKVKHIKKKHSKRVKSSKKSSRTLLMPIVDEHTKLYYEAWLNNTVTVSSQEQQRLDDIILRRLPEEPVKDITAQDYKDKRFTGTIKVNCRRKREL